MTAIHSLSEKEIKELVLKGFVTPDGMWFHYYLKEFVLGKTDGKSLTILRDRNIM